MAAAFDSVWAALPPLALAQVVMHEATTVAAAEICTYTCCHIAGRTGCTAGGKGVR